MNFKDQLKRQLTFIDTSCSLYDQGSKDEAIRIAVAIRVILHDTKKSTSILTHLGIKDTVKLLSTINSILPPNTKDKVIRIHIPYWLSDDGVNPPLDKADRKDFIAVSDWWNEIVFAINTQSARKDIILGAANQDGGAHIDANPKAEIKELKNGVGTFTIKRGNSITIQELTDYHLPMLRQIGYEILNSPDINTV